MPDMYVRNEELYRRMLILTQAILNFLSKRIHVDKHMSDANRSTKSSET